MRVFLKALCLAFSAVALAHRAPAELITEFPLPAGSHPTAIAPGPGGMWFAERESRVGVISPEGRVTEFPVAARAIGIAAGADGNVWFTSSGHLSRITPGGVVTEFPLPLSPGGIAAGPDGSLWVPGFSDERNVLYRATPGGQITEIDLGRSGGYDIAVGADGSLWLTYRDDWGAEAHIARVTPGGAVNSFAVLGHPAALTLGPDGNMWVAVIDGGYLQRMTPAGFAGRFLAPVAGGSSRGGTATCGSPRRRTESGA